MQSVVRWGRSAYETDEALAQEREVAEARGWSWSLFPDRHSPPAVQGDALVVTSKVHVTGEVLDAVRPKLVLTTTSGYEHIDLDAVRARGLVAARCPLARRDAVVEHALVATTWLLRRLPQLHAAAEAGRWARADLPQLAPIGLVGTPIAVVGLGVIGERMARVLESLGAEVLGVDPLARPEGIARFELDEALGRARAVTLHCSLSATSRELISRARLLALAPGTIVVNTSRGDVLDAAAAIELTHAGHLGGVAIDVFPMEPWPDLVQATDRVLLTPHASGYTAGLGDAVAREVRVALEAFADGRPIPARLT